jgi:hypothetical protein
LEPVLSAEKDSVPVGMAVTVIAAVPLTPSLVAVMVADPAACAVTSPAGDTVAAAVLLDVHVTRRPVKTFPAWS